jgi:Domain of unknown function (DUF4160)
MPTLYDGAGLRACVFRDHHPPYVHVYGGDGRAAKIDLRDGRLIVGDIRAREYRCALRWLLEHGDEAWTTWHTLNS